MTVFLAILIIGILPILFVVGGLLTIKLLAIHPMGAIGCLIVAGGIVLTIGVMIVILIVGVSPRSTQVVVNGPAGRVLFTSSPATEDEKAGRFQVVLEKKKTKKEEKPTPAAAVDLPAVKEKPKIAVEARAVRPKWVDAPDAYVGGVYEMTAMSGPFTDDAQCIEAMPREILARVEKYLTEVYRGTEVAGTPSISVDSLLGILPQLAMAQYQETRDTSVGPMRVHYVQLSFGEGVNRWLDKQLRNVVIERRVGWLAASVAGVLMALGAVWMYLSVRP